MKKLLLKRYQTDVMGLGQPFQVDYANQLQQVLNAPRQGGYSLDDIAKRLPVLQKLHQAEDADHVLLENDEHKALVEAVKAYRWPFISQAFIDLQTDVECAPDVTVEEAEDADSAD